jgi:fructuronate reductase
MTHPVRIAHLGLGAFARSHQAWYTQLANDVAGSDGWGIAAFTGRSPRAAEELSSQGSRYTLITRSAEGDEAMAIESIAEAHDGASPAWAETLRSPEVAVVTVTVTEAGYEPSSAAGARLAEGLAARRAASAGPMAIVSCDNLPANGDRLRQLVLANAEPALAEWITDHVSFVLTEVDRITPATTDADRVVARDLAGWDDHAPVVAEPFTEWVLQGDFPAGRPEWEKTGALVVANVEPYEQRKLWLLNAGHSLLAYRGLETGHATVFDAFGDPVLSAEVEQLWAEAREVLAMDAGSVDAWLAALRIRWQNPRIEHRLAQIAQGGEQKIPARIEAVARIREEHGLPVGTAERETIAAWERFREATQK